MFLTEREIDTQKVDVIAHTHCPFASRSTIIESSIQINKFSNESHFEEIRNEFKELIRSSEFQEIDGFKVDIDVNLQSLADLSKILQKLLFTINPSIKSENILKEGWRFTFAGSPFFIVVMSSIYPEKHCRNIPQSSTILFQPEHSFHRFIPRERRKEIATSIRKVF
ncbi:YqcI/YcgG family protein [Sphingobacterium sp. KU25419]|nr:YqcI/YcgG family protein [Sphingobacterium sp. KU25419]